MRLFASIIMALVLTVSASANDPAKRAFPARPLIQAFPASPSPANPFPAAPDLVNLGQPFPADPVKPPLPAIKPRLLSQGHYWNWDHLSGTYRPEGDGWTFNGKEWERPRQVHQLPIRTSSNSMSGNCTGGT